MSAEIAYPQPYEDQDNAPFLTGWRGMRPNQGLQGHHFIARQATRYGSRERFFRFHRFLARSCHSTGLS